MSWTYEIPHPWVENWKFYSFVVFFWKTFLFLAFWWPFQFKVFLTSVHNEKEMEFLFRLTNLGPGYQDTRALWIGGKRSCEKCDTWVWVEGGPINYFKWNPGNPDNWNGKENCIEVLSGRWWNKDYHGTWNDMVCDGSKRGSRKGFVCKKPIWVKSLCIGSEYLFSKTIVCPF